MLRTKREAEDLSQAIEKGRKKPELNELLATYRQVAQGFQPQSPPVERILAKASLQAEVINTSSHKSRKNLFLSVAVGLLSLLFIMQLPKFGLNTKLEQARLAKAALPAVGSYKNLTKLIASKENYAYWLGAENRDMIDFPRTMRESVTDIDDFAAMTKKEALTAENAYSKTNVQVEGVDEADKVKTDGRYIYQVKDNQVVIVKAYPPEDMQVVATIAAEKEFTPQELYIDNKYLTVLGYSSRPLPQNLISTETLGGGLNPQEFIISAAQTVKIIIYDISTISKPVKQREVELEGFLLSSRKIGATLYLIANRPVNYFLDYGFPLKKLNQEARKTLQPAYYDSIQGKGFTAIDFNAIKYFPDSLDASYLLVATLNLNQPKAKMKVATYLGGGQVVYASQNNLYVAVVAPLNEKEIVIPFPESTSYTTIYKFAFVQGETRYVAKGKVPGQILNQFSLDEYQGNLRLATTTMQTNQINPDKFEQSNNLFVLDSSLKRISELINIAPGEQIYSARFMGDRAYLVTFKTVDPFFVIDLQNPFAPKILGELKIPGYSDYLHPYDDNHIIGFGKETTEVVTSFSPGEKMAFYLGMKIALFDVTDVAHSKEMYKVTIGDRGTDSELLRNHKALLFNKEKQLLAFPVTVMTNKSPSVPAPQAEDGPFFNSPSYGQLDFQGAYVYRLSLETGFNLRGKITHWQSFNQSLPQSESLNIVRLLYINDTLYTISQKMIKANSLKNLKEIKAVTTD